MKKSNHKAGADFEKKLQTLLGEKGFWVLRIPNSKNGQPADLLAVKYGQAHLIDCKVCENGTFPYRRIEDNQESASGRWNACGNGTLTLALLMGEQVYMLSLSVLELIKQSRQGTYLKAEDLERYAMTLEKWLELKELIYESHR